MIFYFSNFLAYFKISILIMRYNDFVLIQLPNLRVKNEIFCLNFTIKNKINAQIFKENYVFKAFQILW